MNHDQFNIVVPALPHVSEFLKFNYGSPVEFIEGDLFYDYLVQAVSRRPDKESFDENKIKMARYTEKLTILVPRKFYTTHGLFLTRSNTIKLNRFIDEYIKSVVRMEMISAFAATGRAEAGYEIARVKLGITVDAYPLDSVKKHWQRFIASKPGIISKKFLTQVSPMILDQLQTMYKNANNRTISSI